MAVNECDSSSKFVVLPRTPDKSSFLSYLNLQQCVDIKDQERQRKRGYVMNFAKLHKQDEIRLRRDLNEFDRQKKQKLTLIEKECEQISEEIIHTHRSRVDASAIYVGVLPEVKEAPKVKPLPSDKEYINNIVRKKQRRWKKREALSMKELISHIETRLNSFVHLAKGKDALDNKENKPHFLVPMDENHQSDEQSRIGKRKNKDRNMSLPEIMDLVDANRINARRHKQKAKHIMDGKANVRGKDLPEVDKTTLNRGENYQQADKKRRGSVIADNRLGPTPSNRNGFASITSHTKASHQRIYSRSTFKDLYQDCGNSRYLRTKSPQDHNTDILDVFR